MKKIDLVKDSKFYKQLLSYSKNLGIYSTHTNEDGSHIVATPTGSLYYVMDSKVYKLNQDHDKLEVFKNNIFSSVNFKEGKIIFSSPWWWRKAYNSVIIDTKRNIILD